MSYLVLARKWRPTTFADVVGQTHITRTLTNAIERDRVAHALLFTGSRGVGKTSCARILAKALNCSEGPTPTPCGECQACVEIGDGTSVDVFEIDGASNNSVDQIREIRESVKFMPTRGKRKMYIIDEVHMLSTSAFNALLKTLEEPPAHVLFVFATTEPHKIPDTIISRCQRYDFKRISERDIVGALTRIADAEGLKVEPAALMHIAREARGGMRDSLSLLDQVIAFCGTEITEAQTREVLGIADRKVLHALTDAILESDGQHALDIIDELFRFGLDLQKFAAEYVKHLRDLIVVKVCDDPARLVDLPPGEVQGMAEQIQAVPPARLHRLFDAMMRGADEIARSPFPKLLMEMTLLRLCSQGATLPVAEILTGLARLEARLDEPVARASIGDPSGGQNTSQRRVLHPQVTQQSPVADPVEPISTSQPDEAQAQPVEAQAQPVEAQAQPVEAKEEPVEAQAQPVEAKEEPVQTPWGLAPSIVVKPEPESQQVAEVKPAEASPIVEPPQITEPESAVTPPGDTVLSTLKKWPKSAGWTAPKPDPKVVATQGQIKDLSPLPVKPDIADARQEDAEPPQVDAVPPVVAAAAPQVKAASPNEPELEPLRALDRSERGTQIEHFAHIVEQIRVRDSFLGSELSSMARLVEFGVDELHLVAHFDEVEALSGSLARLEAWASEVVGRPLSIQFEGCKPDDERLAIETLSLRSKRLKKARREKREAAALADGVVQATIAAFGARVIKITPR